MQNKGKAASQGPNHRYVGGQLSTDYRFRKGFKGQPRKAEQLSLE